MSILRKYTYYFYSIFELLFGFEQPFLIASIFLGRAKAGTTTVRLRKSGLRFRIRAAMDAWSIKETFLDRFYEKYGYPVRPDWKIIDIGAGTGEYTIFASTALTRPDGQVYAFEPFPQSFDLMQENLQLNHLQNVQTFNEAIGAENGELVLDLSGGEPLQFQSHDQKPVAAGKGLRVKALSLEAALAQLGLESCDLLKLDCEGAEYPILFSASRATLNRFRHIIMEYHDNVGQPNHAELTRYLSERGFRVESFPNPVHPHLGYLRAAREN